MLAPPRPGRLSGPCGDNLITKDHRDRLVLILHLGHGALQVGSDRGTSFLPIFPCSRMSWSEECGFLLPLFFSILVDLVRCGLSLSLVGVCCSFDFISSVLIVAMASGSKEGESHVSYCLLALPCSSPCMLVSSSTTIFL
jgi:hypothetical protein